jgi:hypothetical protein
MGNCGCQNWKWASTLFLLTIFFASFCGFTNAQNRQLRIKEYVDKEIRLVDDWTGQSVKLIRENGNYYVLRNFFGSGIPVTGFVKYAVKFDNPYSVSFFEVVEFSESSLGRFDKAEKFKISVDENGPNLYLNGLKITTSEQRF